VNVAANERTDPVANTTTKTDTTPAAKPVGRKLDPQTRLKIKSAQAWRPLQGAALTGTIVAIVPRDGDFGRYPVVVLDTGAEHFTAVHAFHGVIVNELREMKAAPGETITIRYDGKRDHNKAKGPDGNPRQYHSYAVVNEADTEVEEWNFDTDTVQAKDDTEDPGY
jgi:hypothetical protein